MKDKGAAGETNGIILFPDYKRQKDEIEKLRTELSMLVLERDELQFVICRNIEANYMLALGGLEYKVYEAQCSYLRLKRKTEMIQAKINRREIIDIGMIEKTLDAEFEEYRKQLDEQIDRMNKAIERKNGIRLSDEDSGKLKTIYRRVIKMLHPDLNPELTEARKKLFENAVEAYKNGDLQTLEIINEIVAEEDIPHEEKDTLARMASEKERLNNMLDKIRDDICRIKTRFPYNVKDIVDDDAEIARRKEEYEEKIGEYNDGAERYKERIREMMRR